MSTLASRKSTRGPDVLIVGAGPAGLATAIGLRLRGLLEVRVLERRPEPADGALDKPCGEGLMPDGVASLRRLGVSPEALPHRPFRGIRWIEDDDRHDGALEVDGVFPGSPGLGIRRTMLHAALLRRARELGVETTWSARVRNVTAVADGVRVETSRGAFEGSWLVGADGLRSPVRRLLGLDAPGDPPRRARFGVRRHVALAPWSDRVEVYWSGDAEAYVTPVGAETVGVAILWSGRKAGFDELLAEFPRLVRRLRTPLGGAPVRSDDRGTGPLRQRVRGVVRGRCALVGDAAGYVDAITGEGLSVAFHQAEALAECLEARDLGPYPARRRAVDRTPRRLTELLLFLERRPRLRRRVFRALAARPDLFERFLAVHVREAPLRGLLPQIPGMAWQLLRAGA